MASKRLGTLIMDSLLYALVNWLETSKLPPVLGALWVASVKVV